MSAWILMFAFGIGSIIFCRTLPSLWFLAAILPLITFFVFNIRRKFIQPLLVFVLGFAWVLLYVHVVTHFNLPKDIEGKNILVTGYIASIPLIKQQGVKFEFDTETINNAQIKTKLKLNWYADNAKQLKVGDKWMLIVRLKRPHGVLNPGGGDFEKQMLIKHIRAIGYVVASDSNKILSSQWYKYFLTRVRDNLIKRINAVLLADSLSAVMTAFVTGLEDEIEQKQWQIMRDTGTSYLVAISGLHIGLVASVVLLLVQFLWRLSGCLPLVMPAREAGIVAGFIAGLIYALISGMSIPSRRALVMLTIFSIMVLSRRKGRSWQAWLWSLLIVLIFNPLAILTIGFWLSFMAVAAIIYVVSNRIGAKESEISSFWRMQLTVTLALLPFTLLFFQQTSLVTIVANIIAMPVVCMVVIPIALFGALLLFISTNLGEMILIASSKIFHLVWWWLSFLADNFSCNWYHPIYNGWVLMTSLIGVALLLAPRGFKFKYLGFVWLAPLYFYHPGLPKNRSEVWFTNLDVGQGLAAVIQTKNHVLLYDTGPRFLDYNAGSNIVIPYLRQMGIKKVDVMMVSHGDSDHSGGAIEILKSWPVNQIVTSSPELFLSYNPTRCFAGQKWVWDGVEFEVLSPFAASDLSGNNASCVLQVKTGSNSLLLPGDIERVAEESLVFSYEGKLKSSIMVAPHHGSATSSTVNFVSQVKPKYVIFPVGYKNRFRFPSKKVLARYGEIDAILLNSAESGAITFKFDDKSAILDPVSYRKKIRRFWHDLG